MIWNYWTPIYTFSKDSASNIWGYIVLPFHTHTHTLTESELYYIYNYINV